MPVISGKPTLFHSPLTTSLVGAFILVVAIAVVPPLVGRTASVSVANRLTLMSGFGCLDFVWSSWPDQPPAWTSASVRLDRTRAGQVEWVPGLRTSDPAVPGPVHHILSVPFWLLLLPLAGVSAAVIRRSAYT